MALLAQRKLTPEVMDQPGLSRSRHRAALRGLARINFWSRSDAILWPALAELARRTGGPVRVLDLATGGGDVPLRLWRRARRMGIDLRLEGCDLSPIAIDHARAAAARAGADVRFFLHDALTGPLLGGYDAVVSSLFLHHLDEEQALAFLQRMGAMARRLVLVNDLRRCLAGLALAHLATRLLTLSSVVHVDGPRSVENAFTPGEALALAERAGLRGARLTYHWPFRFLLRWDKT
jgi:2-polyprenyl-3-methyl-5-hydroxy-6-metoxy-1,4-benzoquinol methylase